MIAILMPMKILFKILIVTGGWVFDMYIDTTEILQLGRSNNVHPGSYWNYAGKLPNARANCQAQVRSPKVQSPKVKT